jgi:hypothetical protein
MEAFNDAFDDFCYRGCRPDYGRNLFAAFAIPFNRSVGRCDADIGRAPQDGRCTRAPRTGNRGSITGLSNCDETLELASRVLGSIDGFADWGLTFDNPDFVAYAAAYGARGRRVTTASGLAPAMEEAFSAGGVHLIAVPIDYSENVRVLVGELRHMQD